MPDLSRLAPKMRSSPVPTLLGEDPDKRTWVRGVVSTMLYLVFSTAIILANKHIITETSFSCPITVSSLGSLFGWIVSIVAVNTGFTELKTHLTLHQWFLLVLPIGVCTALSLAFANIAYFYLTLSFIQMVKAFAPVVTFSILVLFGLDKFDMNVVLAIIVIVAGCFTASFGEMKNKSVQLGILCMLVCEVAEAFRSAGMLYLLAARSFSLFDGMYYFSPATLIFLAGLVYVFEWDQLTQPDAAAEVWANPLAFASASCLGFFVNLASLAVIQNAGSLTLKIVGQLKNIVVIIAAVLIYDDVVTALQIAGYAVALFGFAMYQDAKQRAKDFDESVIGDAVFAETKRASARAGDGAGHREGKEGLDAEFSGTGGRGGGYGDSDGGSPSSATGAGDPLLSKPSRIIAKRVPDL